jgi:hypothetical protein
MTQEEAETLHMFNASLEFDDLVLTNIQDEPIAQETKDFDLELDRLIPDIEDEFIQRTVTRYLDSEGNYEQDTNSQVHPYSVTKPSENQNTSQYQGGNHFGNNILSK